MKTLFRFCVILGLIALFNFPWWITLIVAILVDEQYAAWAWNRSPVRLAQEEQYYLGRVNKVYEGGIPSSKEVPCRVYPHLLPWSREKAGLIVITDADIAYSPCVI